MNVLSNGRGRCKTFTVHRVRYDNILHAILVAAKGQILFCCSAVSPFYIPCLLCLVVIKVIVIIRFAVNHLCTVPPIIKLGSKSLSGFQPCSICLSWTLLLQLARQTSISQRSISFTANKANSSCSWKPDITVT